MPGNGETQLYPNQQEARSRLAGLVGARNTGGRTLCCLVGPQGAGKTYLAKQICAEPDFGPAKRIAVNQAVLQLLEDRYSEAFDFPAGQFDQEIKRWGRSLQDDVHKAMHDQMLAEGLNILDHIELLFALRLNPVTMWYANAVGKCRILLVMTGRMAGQRCQVGHHILTRADQPIVELEAMQ